MGRGWIRDYWLGLILTMLGDIDRCSRKQIPNIYAWQGGEESDGAGEGWHGGWWAGRVARRSGAALRPKLYPSHLTCSFPSVGEGVLGAANGDLEE